jgi:hypothetical protein
VDFSVILIFPFSGLVACSTLVWAAVTKGSRPRLIWPFAFSAFFAAAVFVGLPKPSAILIWLFTLLNVAVWAAFGTVFGAMVARVAVRLLRSR